jgi:hypothetical protein
MKLSEIIRQVGDANVKAQWLSDCMTRATAGQTGTSITFKTDAITPKDLMLVAECKLVGLIVWLPKDKLTEAMQSAPAHEVAR